MPEGVGQVGAGKNLVVSGAGDVVVEGRVGVGNVWSGESSYGGYGTGTPGFQSSGSAGIILRFFRRRNGGHKRACSHGTDHTGTSGTSVTTGATVTTGSFFFSLVQLKSERPSSQRHTVAVSPKYDESGIGMLWPLT